jgi:septum formation protein
MLELDGSLLGKPVDTADAARRIRQQAGRRATLHTGHWLLGPLPPCPKLSPTRAAPNTTPAEPNVGRRGEGATSSTGVLFGQITDSEIEAYVATGEPLAVAGAFTIDGFGGPFIDGIEGDHHGVVGLSLPTLRRLLGRFKVSVVDLWPDSATARSLKRPGRQADIGGTT